MSSHAGSMVAGEQEEGVERGVLGEAGNRGWVSRGWGSKSTTFQMIFFLKINCYVLSHSTLKQIE